MTETAKQTGNDIAENLQTIKAEIAKAALKWDRDNADIELVAVGKRQEVSKIANALTAGHRIFGENRVNKCSCW